MGSLKMYVCMVLTFTGRYFILLVRYRQKALNVSVLAKLLQSKNNATFPYKRLENVQYSGRKKSIAQKIL